MDSGSLADTGRIATELHALLRETDPARFEEGVAHRARERLAGIRRRLRAHIESARHRQPRTSLDESLASLARVVEEEHVEQGPAAPRGNWTALRARLMPAYEHLAAQLRARALPIPTLRPTNWNRIGFHVGSAVIAVFLFEIVLGPIGSIWATSLFAGMCWVLETGRALSGRINDTLMRFPLFKRIIHPHEHHQVNSATWYATALVLLAVVTPPVVAVTGVAVLGIGDPAAGLIGRRWGRHVIHGGRTVEGTAAFVVAATVAAFTVVSIWHPVAPWPALLALSGLSALAGALAEAFSRRIDDNLVVPIAAAAGAWLTGLALGIPLG